MDQNYEWNFVFFKTENELFFKHLCDLVNNAGLVKSDDKNKRYHLKMAEQVIVDGKKENKYKTIKQYMDRWKNKQGESGN